MRGLETAGSKEGLKGRALVGQHVPPVYRKKHILEINENFLLLHQCFSDQGREEGTEKYLTLPASGTQCESASQTTPSHGSRTTILSSIESSTKLF